jgi:hypothetical protein
MVISHGTALMTLIEHLSEMGESLISILKPIGPGDLQWEIKEKKEKYK